MSIDVFSLIGGRRSFAGSMIGGIAETHRVLAFDVRYRFVIDAATFG